MRATPLEFTANLIGLLLLIAVVAFIIRFAIKEPKTTLSLIKAVFEFTKTHVLPKVLKLIVFVAPVTKAMLLESLSVGQPSTSSAFSNSVNKQATYQNGADGALRTQ